MEELKKALQVRERFNKLPFEEFAELLERYIGEKIPKKDKELFKYTGLLNTDFFLMWVSDKLITGDWQLTIPVVRKSFTPDFIVRELEDCEHLDDAIMRFKEQI